MQANLFFSISVGICLLLLQSPTARAGWFGADFSAEVVQGSNQGQRVSGRMYVSKGRVRTEMEQEGQKIIEIIDPGNGRAWLIEPQLESYRERSVPKLVAEKRRSGSPCHIIPGAECRQLPDEILNGRSTKKWLLRLNGQERLQWNDARHGFPVQVAEGGRVVMAMVYLGDETLEGRRVEHWRALQQGSKGIWESEQWYDPQLNIAVRQQAKDGSYRELRNIRLGEQRDDLFVLPKGLNKMDTSAQQGGGSE